MALDIDNIIKIEESTAEYLNVVNDILNDLLKEGILSKTDDSILNAAWVTIRRNAFWYLDNYRVIVDDKPSVPISECLFACRLIMECAADCRYFLLASDDCKEVFLKEYKAFSSDFDISWGNLGDKWYPRDKGYIPPQTTMDRIELCFGRDGVGHYQMLCWSTHLSFIGYKILERDSLGGSNYKIRMNGLIYILAALDAILETLLEKSAINDDRGKNIVTESHRMINDLKEMIKDE